MKQPLVALDQFLNTLIPPYADAWADETFSSRAYRNARNQGGGWETTRRVIDGIFFWQHQHCFMSYMSEFDRMQLPPEFRNKKKENLWQTQLSGEQKGVSSE